MGAPPIRDPAAVYLVDGNYWIRRFFHAIQKPQMNASGQDVAAVQSLRDMVKRLHQQFAPNFVIAVFDGEGAFSGRRGLLPTYKADRSERPKSLSAQIELAIEHLPRYGAPTVMVPGVEADDVIVQLATDLHRGGFPAFIVSGDKDFAPHVRDGYPPVAIYTKGDESWTLLREEDVRQRHGVEPGKVLDVFALAGDKSDGIPGVEGIGPKKAAELIREYQSLDTLLALASTIRGEAIRERLCKSADSVRLYRRVLEPVPISLREIEAHTRR